jgi:hypothetical protein
MRSVNRGVMVICAPVAGVMADAAGFRITLVAAAVVFAIVTAALPPRRSESSVHRCEAVRT